LGNRLRTRNASETLKPKKSGISRFRSAFAGPDGEAHGLLGILALPERTVGDPGKRRVPGITGAGNGGRHASQRLEMGIPLKTVAERRHAVAHFNKGRSSCVSVERCS
jgi:hypothetical protein